MLQSAPNQPTDGEPEQKLDNANERDWSRDFWVDAKTKQLVAIYSPGGDIYDPDRDPVRNNPPGKEPSKGETVADGWHDMQYDVALDDSLFRLQPPEGYVVELRGRRVITEKTMIDFLGVVAEFNDRTFPEQATPTHSLLTKVNRTLQKSEKALTKAEKNYLETAQKYGDPDEIILWEFYDVLVPNTFRYLGKGVKLGDKDRIVCWYKLKDAKNLRTYRVVYGDLTVKDVAPEGLPLPVDP